MLFARPHRFVRPARLAIILRGLPGAGKSMVAENIRVIEARYSKTVKIFHWDDYFEEVNFTIKYFNFI